MPTNLQKMYLKSIVSPQQIIVFLLQIHFNVNMIKLITVLN